MMSFWFRFALLCLGNILKKPSSTSIIQLFNAPTDAKLPKSNTAIILRDQGDA